MAHYPPTRACKVKAWPWPVANDTAGVELAPGWVQDDMFSALTQHARGRSRNASPVNRELLDLLEVRVVCRRNPHPAAPRACAGYCWTALNSSPCCSEVRLAGTLLFAACCARLIAVLPESVSEAPSSSLNIASTAHLVKDCEAWLLVIHSRG